MGLGEDVWAARLVRCIEISGVANGVRLIPAFTWSPRAEINTLFPHIMSVRAAPFHGMTDLLLLGPESDAIVRVTTEKFLVCTIEVGINRVATTPVTIGDKMKMWRRTKSASFWQACIPLPPSITSTKYVQPRKQFHGPRSGFLRSTTA